MVGSLLYRLWPYVGFIVIAYTLLATTNCDATQEENEAGWFSLWETEYFYLNGRDEEGVSRLMPNNSSAEANAQQSQTTNNFFTQECVYWNIGSLS